MTPAEELRAAAARLRELIEAVPRDLWGDRPWHVEACSETATDECPCIVTQGEYKPFDQPQDPMIQYVADVETTGHANYIAAMHPGVGLPLAKVFDAWARMVDLDPDLLNRIGGTETLAVARAINGGEQR